MALLCWIKKEKNHKSNTLANKKNISKNYLARCRRPQPQVEGTLATYSIEVSWRAPRWLSGKGCQGIGTNTTKYFKVPIPITRKKIDNKVVTIDILDVIAQRLL